MGRSTVREERRKRQRLRRRRFPTDRRLVLLSVFAVIQHDRMRLTESRVRITAEAKRGGGGGVGGAAVSSHSCRRRRRREK